MYKQAKCVTVNLEVTRSTIQGACRIPQSRAAFGPSSFIFTAIKQWNSLPTEFTKTTNFHTCSSSTKQWILAQRYSTHQSSHLMPLCACVWGSMSVCFCMCVHMYKHIRMWLHRVLGSGDVGMWVYINTVFL